MPFQNGSNSEGEDEGSDWDLEGDDIEVTDVGGEVDGTAIDALLSGSQWKGVLGKGAFRYRRSPTLSVYSQLLKRKAD